MSNNKEELMTIRYEIDAMPFDTSFFIKEEV